MTTKATFLTAAVLATLCAGCRSDGGIGRADNARGMKFVTDSLAGHFRSDVAATSERFSNVSEKVSRHVSNSLRDLRETYYLYLENGRGR